MEMCHMLILSSANTCARVSFLVKLQTSASGFTSRPCKKCALRNFENSQNTTCTRVSFLILKKRLWHRCFSANCAKFLTTSFLNENLWWFLLVIQYNEIGKWWLFLMISFINVVTGCYNSLYSTTDIFTLGLI